MNRDVGKRGSLEDKQIIHFLTTLALHLRYYFDDKICTKENLTLDTQRDLVTRYSLVIKSV